MRKFLIAIFFVFGSIQAFSQANCSLSLSGQVIDHHDDTGLVGAVVRFQDQVAITDEFGKFNFVNLCAGDFGLNINHVSCEPYSTTLNLTSSQSKTFYLEHHDELIEEIEISTIAKAGSLSVSSQTKTSEELDLVRGNTLGDMISDMNGVSLLKTGATITKPIINGLHSQRVLLINDGNRMEGQRWGSEHAPEVDSYSVNRVSVIQGAGTVEFGSDGIGGAIVIDPPALPDHYGIQWNPDITIQSNGRSMGTALDVLGKKKIFSLPLSFELQGALKKQGNLKAPEYYLDNTGVEEGSYQIRTGYVGDQFGLEGKLSLFSTSLGILSDSHIGNEQDLLEHIQQGRPSVDRGFSYDILRPYQQISHEINQLEAYYKSKIGQFDFMLGRQYNRRSEFDQSNEEPGIQLKTETYSSDVGLTHHLGAGWNGKVGGQYQRQRFRANGFYLLPEYNRSNFGLFGFEQYNFSDDFAIEAGIRSDFKKYEYFIPVNSFRLLDDSNIQYQSLEDGLGIIRKSFTPLLSGSLGFSWQASEIVTVSSYLGFGSREPLPNELYSDGVHHGTALWEVGNPYLGIEHSTNGQLNTDFKWESIQVGIQPYFNSIQNYTYHIPDDLLDPIFTIRGTFPIMRTIQHDVSMVGLNYHIDAQLNEQFELNTSGSFLKADDKELNQPLIFMPSNQLHHQVTFKPSVKWTTSLGLDQVFRQKRIPDSDVIPDYVAPPPGYFLVNLRLGYEAPLANHPFHIALNADNLFNKSYRNYLDAFRYYADAPGFNFGLRFNYLINENKK